MKDIHEQTYYELLDIPPTASQEEILNAYKKARATYSNNSPALYSLFNKEEAEELLKLIDEAYTVLSNQYKRKAYDKDKLAAPSGDDHSAEKTPTSHHFAPPSAAILEPSPLNVPGQKGVYVKNPATDPGQPGTTRFGKYQFDSKIEDEIKNQTQFSGAFLKKIRLYKNISLDQISEVTKISRAYLNAIEGDDFSCLPAPVFLRGFLVQLAKSLSLDANTVSSSYLALMKEASKK